METKELINLIQKEIEKWEEKKEYLQQHISNTELLAKNDLRTLENYRDSIETFKIIELKLENLQNRIIERNKKTLI